MYLNKFGFIPKKLKTRNKRKKNKERIRHDRKENTKNKITKKRRKRHTADQDRKIRKMTL
jgi:hypothetical protein